MSARLGNIQHSFITWLQLCLLVPIHGCSRSKYQLTHSERVHTGKRDTGYK